ARVVTGTRTWIKFSPYPKEMNSLLFGVFADMHFSQIEKVKPNLLAEFKQNERIYSTSYTAIDTLKTTVREEYVHPVLEQLNGRRLVLITAHRRENLGENMEQMFRAIKRLVAEHEDIKVVYPVHLNPVVRETANEILGGDE